MITVKCHKCLIPLAEWNFPSRERAEAFVRRHHALVGHRANIQEEP